MPAVARPAPVVATRAGANARFGFTAASLGPCYRLELSRALAVASCGSLLLGSLSVAINTPEPVDAGARLWLGGAVGLRLGVQLGALELGLSAEALAHFNRRDYTVQRLNPSRSESLFTEPAAAGMGAVSVGGRF